MERFVRVDGLNVRCLAEGEGPAVLLLHGASLGSSADVWIGNLPGLAARGFRAIAFDQPGFGGTDNPADASLAYRRGFILALLDALGLQRAPLVGHSQAGRIAVDLAFRNPARVTGVIVLGTGSLLPPLPGKEGGGEGEEGGAAEPTLAETRAALEATVYRRELVTPRAVELRQRMSIGKNFRAFLERKASPREKSEKLWQKLGECPVPLLLLYGKEDRGNAAERAGLAKRMHPGLDLHVLDRCKHLVQWDAADAFVDLAARFLTAL